MGVDDLAFFRVVAGSESLTAAARELASSLPVVSRRLSALEQRLEVRLVQRGARRLTLTSEGQLYATRGAAILDQIAELDDQIADRSGPLRGSMTVMSTPGIGRAHIAPLLGAFLAKHPALHAQLQISSLPLQPQRRAFDVAIRVGSAPDSSLKMRRLAQNRRVPCASPAYLARRGTPSTVGELAEHDCIALQENEASTAVWTFGDRGIRGVQIKGHLSSNDGDVVTTWALDGRGIIMRSEWQVRQHLMSGALVRVLPEVATPEADVYALYDAERHVPRRVVELIDFLAERLPRRLA
ncbi:LysR family transcriptional regulator [Dactylosporangium sp. CA-092794]|uniref:LysR family transcriptional regulator n=1 Tax=Dactylosporangium sp. CA-092794 TaxID=3239929 RepID=UPI003D94A433